MNGTNRWAQKIGFACCSSLLGLLAGCTVYEEPPRDGGAYYEPSGPAEASYVEIRSESDFYEPLSPYGRWEVIGSFGRCWIPGGVEAGWSPYANGYWQQTDAGWYWASEEPWGWATYHYGRWDLSPRYGWYWVPRTEWAPAWVSWRQGGGYVGWAPMGPSMRAGERGGPSHGYVFVEERRFLEPNRSRREPANDSFIDRTVEITRTHTANRTLINEGPGAVVIEQASGHKIQAAPVRELRTRDEAKSSARHQAPAPARPQDLQRPVRNEAPAPERKTGPAHEPRQVERPAPKVAEPPPPAVRREVPQSDQNRNTKPAVEKRGEPRTEGPKGAPVAPSSNPKPDVTRHGDNQGPAQPKNVGKRPEQPAKRSEEAKPKTPPVSEQHAKPEPAPSDQKGTGATKDDHKQRDEN
jgi:hypothetical protein